MPGRNAYKWFYDHVHSGYYDLLVKWCFAPFGGEGRLRELLLAPVRFPAGERVLDMCCGTGGATRTIAGLAGRECQLFGLDLSIGQLRHARRHPELDGVHFVEADAFLSPFIDGVFDKVVIPHALHEMYREVRLAVLAEARRILRDGGTVVVLELDRPAHRAARWFVGGWFFYWLPFNFETPTRRDMLRHGVAREVEEAGFREVTKTSRHRGAFQTVVGVK
jgi:ubiquinone/menaquinone biosynthesis C-methylase UbiE